MLFKGISRLAIAWVYLLFFFIVKCLLRRNHEENYRL